MQFQCETTDGPAQIGKLKLNRYETIVPTILFPSSSDYNFSLCVTDLISSSQYLNEKAKPSLLQIGNSVFFRQIEHDDSNRIQNFMIIPESLPPAVTRYLFQYDDQQNTSIQLLPLDDTLVDQIDQESTQLLIVSNAMQLFQNPKKFISIIKTIRSKCNYDSLIYLPSVMRPSNIALLCYLGVDLFDATITILDSRFDRFYLPDTSISHKKSLQENPCTCPVCVNAENLPSSYSFDELLKHNCFMISQELLSVRHAIRNHHLRDIVEKRIRNSTDHVTILRYLDSTCESYLEERTSVTSAESYLLQSTSRESGVRAEIKRFQKRLFSRYQKPKGKKILLLLPCSAKKPYSFSKSHQRFNRIISKIKNHSIIHELIITSPLGLVPRELELTYPASSYDISVTGSWYRDEICMIQTLLDNYLQKNHYDAIVSHLSDDIIHSPENINTNWFQSVTTGKAIAKTNLNQLHDLLTDLTSSMDFIPMTKAKQKQIQIQSIASYQFGSNLAEMLTNNIKVKGKYPFLKFFDEQNNQLGTIPDGRGLISLTADGGKRISDFQQYRVTINTGFTVKGSILAPGVSDADVHIRKGDDVTVFQGDSYLGVGTAQMNGNEMVQRQYGIAVNMRHKLKK